MRRTALIILAIALVLLLVLPVAVWKLTTPSQRVMPPEEVAQLHHAEQQLPFGLKAPRYLPGSMKLAAADVTPPSGDDVTAVRLVYTGQPGLLEFDETQAQNDLVYPEGLATVREVRVGGKTVEINVLDASGHVYRTSMTAQVHVGDIYISASAKNLSQQEFVKVLASFR